MTEQNANNRETAERWLANAENAELGFMSKMATMIHAVKLCREYPDLAERVEKIEECITENSAEYYYERQKANKERVRIAEEIGVEITWSEA